MKACLWRGERALAAWAEWRAAEAGLAKVEPGSSRLLPLVYRNLGRQLAEGPDATWLKDAYRASWTANQLGLRAGRRAIDALLAVDIDVLALKGAALIGSVYGDLGARPMGDIDLAVPQPRVGDAFKVIEAGDSQLDWQRLATMTCRGRLIAPIVEALDFLAEDLEAPVPGDIRAELSRAPVSRAERRAHDALARPPSSRRSVAMVSRFWERHRAQAALDGEQPRLAGFVRYMQSFWGLERPSQVPAYAMRRLLRRRA